MKIGDIERPCHNCTERHVESGYNCHSDCPRYKKFERANRERLDKISQKRDEEMILYQYKRSAIAKAVKREHKRNLER